MTAMDDDAHLELAYRRLLLACPVEYRHDRGEEISNHGDGDGRLYRHPESSYPARVRVGAAFVLATFPAALGSM